LCNPSTGIAKYKVWVIPIIRLNLTRIGQCLFASADALAQRHEWQVTPVHHGLGRRYRDPRFDCFRAPARSPARDGTGHA